MTAEKKTAKKSATLLDGRPSWTEIAVLLLDAYRMKAPKRLAALLPDD
jgi:hypothetical protein